MGSGQNGELSAIDILSVLSFIIGLKNLDLNIDQNDMDAQTRDIDERANKLVGAAIAEIHAHLEEQDKIMEVLKIEVNQENVKND